MDDPKLEHMKELGEIAFLSWLDGKITYEQATEGLIKRRTSLGLN